MGEELEPLPPAYVGSGYLEQPTEEPKCDCCGQEPNRPLLVGERQVTVQTVGVDYYNVLLTGTPEERLAAWNKIREENGAFLDDLLFKAIKDHDNRKYDREQWYRNEWASFPHPKPFGATAKKQKATVKSVQTEEGVVTWEKKQSGKS